MANADEFGMPVHPVCGMFPLMDAEALSGLAFNIEKYGLINPVVIHEGQLVDGRNRVLACRDAGVQPTVQQWRDIYKGTESVADWIWSTNVERRHMTEDQYVAVSVAFDAWRKTEEAHQKMIDGGKAAGRGRSLVEKGAMNSSHPIEGRKRAPDTRTQIATKLKVSEHKVQQALNVQKSEPALLNDVARGVMSLKDADKKTVKKSRKPRQSSATDENTGAPAIERAITLTTWKAMTTGREALLQMRNQKAKLNRQNTDSIEWARWSWNPVTGCLHNCPYCYARDMAERFYAQKFEPSIVPNALAAPLNISPAAKGIAADLAFKNIFTCSMADLFGNWVPREWIEAVLSVVREAKGWNFLMLTKFPQRLKEFDFPANAWLGTSIDLQARVPAAERAMRDVKASVKWLSIEPLIEPVTIDFSLFQWVVIGGASKSSQTPEWKPPRHWVAELTARATEAGCAVYHKDNLNLNRLRNYPGAAEPEPSHAPSPFHYLKLNG